MTMTASEGVSSSGPDHFHEGIDAPSYLNPQKQVKCALDLLCRQNTRGTGVEFFFKVVLADPFLCLASFQSGQTIESPAVLEIETEVGRNFIAAGFLQPRLGADRDLFHQSLDLRIVHSFVGKVGQGDFALEQGEG